MPKSIRLSKFEIDFLRNNLEQISGIKINQSSDCLALQDYIFRKHAILISNSTLRRLYDLVPSNQTSSLNTLNIYSRILGYQDWNKLSKKLSQSSYEETSYLLLYSYIKDKQYFNDRYLDIESLDISTWAEAYQLFIYCNGIIASKNEEMICKLLSKSYNKNNQEQYDYLMFALQPFCLAANEHDELIIQVIKKLLPHAPLALEFVLYAQVFDDQLHSFYGDWVNELAKSKNHQNDAFVYLMLIQKAMLNKEINLANKLLYQLTQKNGLTAIHPILKGRLAAWLFILNNDKTFLTESLSKASNDLETIEILQFYSRLVWQYHNPNEYIEAFDYYDIKEVNQLETFYNKGKFECFKISLAWNLRFKKDQNYQQLLRSINPNYFHISNLRWYEETYLLLL
jgi:hypothetical protein